MGFAYPSYVISATRTSPRGALHKQESRRADSNRFPRLITSWLVSVLWRTTPYQCVASEGQDLHYRGLARPTAFRAVPIRLQYVAGAGFPYYGLSRVAAYRAPGGVRVVSEERGFHVAVCISSRSWSPSPPRRPSTQTIWHTTDVSLGRPPGACVRRGKYRESPALSSRRGVLPPPSENPVHYGEGTLTVN